jgi:hypothetical protein
MRPLSMKKWKKGLIRWIYENVANEKIIGRSGRMDL